MPQKDTYDACSTSCYLRRSCVRWSIRSTAPRRSGRSRPSRALRLRYVCSSSCTCARTPTLFARNVGTPSCASHVSDYLGNCRRTAYRIGPKDLCRLLLPATSARRHAITDARAHHTRIFGRPEIFNPIAPSGPRRRMPRSRTVRRGLASEFRQNLRFRHHRAAAPRGGRSSAPSKLYFRRALFASTRRSSRWPKASEKRPRRSAVELDQQVKA